MRIVRTAVQEDRLDAVVEILNSENIDYVITRELSERGDLAVVEFLVPEQALEVVLGQFDEVGHGEHDYTAITDARAALSSNIEEIEDRFVVGEEEDSSIATEELRSQVLQLLPNEFIYYVLTFLSAIVATAGLLLNAPALVVGSMVIAPLVGSSLTASVGTVLSDRDMILTGFRTQLFGLGIAVLGAVAFSLLLKSGVLVPPSMHPSTTSQIANRISPGLLSLIIGICAGAAGAISISTAISAALVGVMIAAALIPAAAAVGIGIVWSVPAIALGAGLLLVVNAASIHVSGVAVFWTLGYRPKGWIEDDRWSNFSIREFAPSLVVGALVIALFASAGGLVWTHVSFEQSANIAVEETLAQERYDELELIGVNTAFSPALFSTQHQRITVTIRRPAGQPFPHISSEIRVRTRSATDRDPIVLVEFVESLRAGPESD